MRKPSTVSPRNYSEWIEQAEPIAFGVLGIRPEDFYEMTPSEFYSAFEGYGFSQEREIRDRARFVAAILSVCGPADKHGRRKRFKTSDLAKDRSNPPRNIFYYALMGKKLP